MKKYLFMIILLIICGCSSQNNNVQELLNEGASLFQKGDYDAAIQKYNEALQIDSNNSVGYNLLGMAYRFKFNQTGTQEYKDKVLSAKTSWTVFVPGHRGHSRSINAVYIEIPRPGFYPGRALIFVL